MAKDLTEFYFSSDVKRKIKNKSWLKQELSQGTAPQTLVNFSDETMSKFYQAAYHLFEVKQNEKAADAFLFLATLNPHHHDYWLGLGMATQLMHDYEGAIDAYELAALCEMDNPVPYFYLAKCLFAIHDRDSALQAIELAIEMAGEQEEYKDLKEQVIHARIILLRD